MWALLPSDLPNPGKTEEPSASRSSSAATRVSTSPPRRLRCNDSGRTPAGFGVAADRLKTGERVMGGLKEAAMSSATRPDYIIVGGGSAGCILAARLSE